jgi:nicotinate-nucleotide pyrophosphorylase (carboxylating)
MMADGDPAPAGATVASVCGPRHAVLQMERTLLNFLGRMSGVATLTRRFVDTARAANPSVAILDTRKTLPGWRELDRYAVRCGGGVNHRQGLYDAVLIKDNHLAGTPLDQLAETVSRMAESARALQPAPRFVEVEVDGLEQLSEALRASGVDFILLDNFTTADLRAAVRMRGARGRRGQVGLEASGGVTLATVADIAATGVERISVGALTHSAVSLDLGLDL